MLLRSLIKLVGALALYSLLLVPSLLLPAPARGQQLLGEILHQKHYQVYKESMSHFNVNTNQSEEIFSSNVNYLVTRSKEGMQMRRVTKNKPLLSNTNGFLVCQLTGLKYQNHSYSANMLIESYRGVYQAYLGGAMPPFDGLPNPSNVEVSWAVNSKGSRSMQVYWYYGPKKKPATLFGQSYFVYFFDFKQLD
jgi:hypothetical protein